MCSHDQVAGPELRDRCRNVFFATHFREDCRLRTRSSPCGLWESLRCPVQVHRLPMRPTAQRAVSRRRLITERIFSKSGSLSSFLRGPRISDVRSRQTRGPEDREETMTTCVFPSRCRFPRFFKPSRAVGVDAQHGSIGPLLVGTEMVSQARVFGAAVLVWSLPIPSAFLVFPRHAVDVNLEARV